MRGRRGRRSCLIVWCRGSLGRVVGGKESYVLHVSSYVGCILAVVDLGVGRRRRQYWLAMEFVAVADEMGFS